MQNVEIIQRGHMPESFPNQPTAEWIAACLRQFHFVPHPDWHPRIQEIVPLSGSDELLTVATKWAGAMRDVHIRDGYLPSTPDTVGGWMRVMGHFTQGAPSTVFYAVLGNQCPYDILAEVNFTFSTVASGLEAEFAYSLLDQKMQRMGVVSDSFGMLQCALPQLISQLGFHLHRIHSMISERNVASLGVARKVGLQPSEDQEMSLSPIRMGGRNIHYEHVYLD